MLLSLMSAVERSLTGAILIWIRSRIGSCVCACTLTRTLILLIRRLIRSLRGDGTALLLGILRRFLLRLPCTLIPVVWCLRIGIYVLILGTGISILTLALTLVLILIRVLVLILVHAVFIIIHKRRTPFLFV